MHNGNKPNPEDLPTSAQLRKSTLIAAVSALAILTLIVLPSEYGIDPTGIGRAIGLTEMGDIKVQLAEEAEADSQMQLIPAPIVEEQSSLGSDIFSLFVGAAYAQSVTPTDWKEQHSFTLTPGEGTEIKLGMTEGANAEYIWVAEGGVVNYDLHGDGGGQNISYEKGRAVAMDEGVLTAAFTGNHGWFWRNRDGQDVTVTLYVRGDYTDLKIPK
ncbi:MAG TPA: transmembrane anchor protein [Roseobacter sp.]|uniref:Transmembrane anchor protein n=1 Tax=marine sediment metagenome TaxID=412755 RepID=A0A0F9KJG7_9ZZZZ|nr:transmembrane anchor protein [Roseobacter sp.]